METTTSHQNLALAPLGPGDLIDRAVRFYRQNFLTFVMIAAPPIVLGTAISVAWTMLARWLLITGAGSDPFETAIYYIFSWFGSLVIMFTESAATLCVMGGASRNFVRHLLYGEKVTFKETYRNVRSRLGALAAASALITLILGGIGFIVVYFGLLATALLAFLAIAVLESVPPLAALVGIVLAIAGTSATLWLFFLIASRFVFVPQVLLVEGQGIGSSIARSASLAGGSVKRLAALFIFSTVAVYAALAVLYVPLAWYAWSQGAEIFIMNRDLIPAWYEIVSQLVWQASLILMTPVWMVGLCLMYVDERVRHEGYDIELMAARYLGEIPAVPSAYANPLQPALGERNDAAPPAAARERRTSFTTLDLK